MIEKLCYVASGIVGRITKKPRCPCCPSLERSVVDKKGPFILYKCNDCSILYRFPSESELQMLDFYQNDYEQTGLTTDLPSEDKLRVLVNSNFAGTEKDASSIIAMLEALELPKGSRVLDFGANWGYSVHQLRKAGYHAEGYELSKPRASFGEKLGVKIHTSTESLSKDFDCVFSSHVLEHVPDPLQTLKVQLSLVATDGFVLGFTPNGSEERISLDFRGFHRHWNRVHPVLLSNEFLKANFSEYPIYICSHKNSSDLNKWDKATLRESTLDSGELIFAIKNSDLKTID